MSAKTLTHVAGLALALCPAALCLDVVWSTAAAQIEVGTLDDARDVSAGLLDIRSGGLDRNAWSGTGAALAIHLVERLPDTVDNPVAGALIEAALLSSGVPPEGPPDQQAAWEDTRNAYLLASGRGEALAGLARRDIDLERDTRLQADIALEAGDTARACRIADDQSTDRSAPTWAKLRAFCHAVRGETAAAELTAELLRDSGHEDAVFTALLRERLGGTRADVAPVTPLHRAMAHRDTQTEDVGALDALLTRLDEDPSALLPEMSALAAGNGGSYVFADAVDDDGDLATARLYVLAFRDRSGEAMAEWLERMSARGILRDAAAHAGTRLQTLPAAALAAERPGAVARAAVINNDVGALLSLFGGLPETPTKARLALVSDALGGGFRLRPVGEELEAPLIDGQTRAQSGTVGDILVALALGARLSEEAAIAFDSVEMAAPETAASARALLRAAVREGARAEVALRAAALTAGAETDAALVADAVAALQDVGLDRFARQLAALHFAGGI